MKKMLTLRPMNLFGTSAFLLTLLLLLSSKNSSAQVSFTHGSVDSVTNLCYTGSSDPVDLNNGTGHSVNLLQVNEPTASLTLTWTLISGPSHGSVTGLPYVTTSSVGINTPPSGIVYDRATLFSGSDSFLVAVSDGSTSDTIKIIANTYPLPSIPGAITGPTSECLSTGTATYSNSTSGGSWFSPSTAISLNSTTGVATLLSTGTATIFYTVVNTYNCRQTVTLEDTVLTVPTVPGITGATSVCAGSSTTLSNTTSGGVWVSRNNAIATVNSSTGIVTGNSAGSTIIVYTVTNICGTAADSVTMTVSGSYLAGIHGPDSVCVGSTTNLTDSTTGGTWSSSNTALATVNAAGVVRGVSTGSVTIFYTVTDACGTRSKTYTVRVQGTAVAAISGRDTVCTGGTITLADATAGGTWSSSNITLATIDPATGVVTGGSSTGSLTISYSVVNSCGTNVVTKTLVVSAGTTPSPITGTTSVCTGSTTSLADASTSSGLPYTWFSVNTSKASVDGAGNVTVVTTTADTVTIGFSLTSSCGVNTATVVLNILTVPTTPAAISVTSPICTGSSATATDATTGGTWSSSNTSVFIATGSGTTGTVTGVSAGAAVLSYTVSNFCGTSSATTAVTILAPPATPAAISGTTVVCAGSSTALTDATTGGSWSSSNGSIATVNSSGVVTGVAAGSCNISYTVTNSCGSSSTVASYTVNDVPAVSSITPSSTAICTGSSVTLTASPGTGTWSSSNTSVASVVGGVVTGAATGTATISYAVTNGCGTTTRTASVTVSTTPPSPAAIVGADTVCLSSTITLTDATSGGTWSSSNGSVATVNSSGVVTGVAAGAATITYSVTSSCGTAIAVHNITTATAPSTPAVISGTSPLCVGSTTTFTDATTGGAWTSSNSAVATVDASTGVVTGVATGVANITYTVSNVCGSANRNRSITINTVPAPPAAIAALASVCVSSTFTATDATAGGSWSVTNSNATISGTGLVTGVAVGTDTIVYTVTNACGSTSVTRAFNITTTPTVAAISGATTVCRGSTTTYTDATSGGTWSSSNSAIAAVTAAGVVSGVATGTATITYTVNNSCGSSFVTQSITVTTIPTAPAAISGSTTVCLSSTTTYSDATSGGTWSSVSPSVATIDASGNITPVTTGSSVISYTVSNACGINAATKTITVITTPTVSGITGASSMCISSTTTMSDATGGGTWSSSDASVATITSTGVVTSTSTAGSVVISYAVTNSCGTTYSTRSLTVTTGPTAPAAISGPSTVCVGSTVTLTDATSGGSWTSVFPTASVSSSGVVTGNSVGTAVISYTVTNSCGTNSITDTLNVITVPSIPSPITGADTVCLGGTITLTGGVSGGTWASSSATTATVDGGGVVTGANVGTVLISYTVNNVCGASSPATKSIRVITVPTVPAIGGSTTVCMGSTTVLTDATPGGVWSSGSPAVATIDASTGVAGGVAVGVTNITYTLTNMCGSSQFVRSLTVNTVPNMPGPIRGATQMCLGGSTTTLADDTLGGVWSSSNTSVAMISASGVVSAVSLGTTTISYTVTNACGSTSYTMPFSVITLPTVAPITGVTQQCIGATSTLSSATPGGSWYSSNTAIANISSSGVVTGNTAGSVTILYTVTNMCGSTTVFTYDTVSTTSVASVTGPSDVCTGSTISLVCTTTGGSWTSSNFTVATVSSTGTVTGVDTGFATITYSVVNACGTNISTKTVRVSSNYVASITGSNNVCVAANATLSDSTFGGTWLSSDPTVLTINSSTGVMTGVTAGSAIIQYSVTNACGGPFSQFLTVTVNPLADPGVITGTSTTVCEGSSIVLADTATGGSWSSSDNTLATVTTGGVVTGVAAGSVVISYTKANICGPRSATYSVTVNPLPVTGAIVGAPSVCEGSTTTLTNPTAVPAGAWSTGGAGFATISSTGVVTGVTAGTETISYTVTNSCGVATITTSMVVNPLPAVGTISGPTSVCEASTITLTNSGAAFAGTWASGNTSIATVNSSTGDVTGVAGGSVTISYVVTSDSGCVASSTYGVTVNPLPRTSSIGGTPVVCEHSTTTLTNTVSGGTWISGNPFIATVDASGTVYGVAFGTVTITYEFTNICGTSDSTISVTVNPVPDAGVISGSTSVCQSSVTTLVSTVSGGTWSSSDATVASVDPSTGDVYGVAVGTVTITYSYTNSCGTSDSTIGMEVLPLPYAGVITGSTFEICSGSTTTVGSSVAGGWWFSSDPTVATIDMFTGDVTGVDPGGLCLLIYSYTNSCGTDVASVFFTVDQTPFVIGISGPDTVCVGSTIYLNDTTLGAMTSSWSSSDPSVATVDAVTGAVTGVAGGTANITYTLTSATCGSADTFKTITVIPTPVAGTISGAASVCVASSTTMTSTGTGGVWSTSDTSIATIDSVTGAVTGITAGFVNITYTVTNYCGSDIATQLMTVNPLPRASSIYTIPAGLDSLCVGSTLQLYDSVAGGSWSSGTPLLAYVDGSGLVTAYVAGTAVISYSVTNVCGTADSTFGINILPLPVAGTVSGATNICEGSTSAYSSTATGGVWSSSDVTIATIDGATGIAGGVSTGTAVLSYSVTNSCGTAIDTMEITIDPLPVAGTISGSDNICSGATTTYTNAGGTAGGTWVSTNTSVLTIDPTTGDATGGVAGSATVYYIATTVCGSDTASFTVTVNPLPSAGFVSGPDTVCFGGNITLTTSSTMTAFGAWVSADASIASVGAATGVVVGNYPGTTDIMYIVTTTYCGADTAHHTVYVDSLPRPGIITGVSSICVGVSEIFTESVPGGVWSMYSTGAVATVSSTGVVTGVASGVDTVYYSVTNHCGTSRAAFPIVVNPLPLAGVITGTTTLCEGATSTLTDTASGGTGAWSTSDAGIAYTTGTGSSVTLHAVAPGTDTIFYTVTSSLGCSSSFAYAIVTVNTLPHIGAIFGPSVVCEASTITLSDTLATPPGVWSSSALGTATVVASTGVVTGVAAGAVTISYIVSTATCGSDTATYAVTVRPLPIPGTISGTSPICEGTTTGLTTTGDAGGTWSIAPAGYATISATTGVVTGVAAGTAIATYSVTNSCGTLESYFTVVVNAAPRAGTITGRDSVCVLSTSLLLDATGMSGGTWFSSAPTIATVTGGLVTGAAGGTTTINYAVSTASCGSDTAHFTMHVVPLADTGFGIFGLSHICEHSYDTMTISATGGSWTSSNTAVAAVSAAGVVRGVSAGSAIISYTATSAFCGSLSATFRVTIDPLPVVGTISGPHSVCIGDAVTLTESAGVHTTFTWTDGGSGVDSVGVATGVVTGLGAGTDLITFTATTVCGSASATYAMTVNPLPDAGIITGPTTVCVGDHMSLTESVTGGTWSSGTTSIATVNTTTGEVYGVSAGTVHISYTVPSLFGCADGVTWYEVTVNPLPDAGVITGTLSVCIGATTALTDVGGTPGGSWTAATSTILTVDTVGVVTGVSGGTEIVTYTAHTATCGDAFTTASVTVIPNPYAGAIISSVTEFCQGTTITVGATETGGSWSVSSGLSITGAGTSATVTGVAGGVHTISYTMTNACGSDVATLDVNVDSLPTVAVITGTTSVCTGSGVTTLVDATTGGVWSSSDPTIASVDASTGYVTPGVAGVATIYYSVTNHCGTTTRTVTFTVNQTPNAGTISGATSLCPSLYSTYTISGAVGTGTWSHVNFVIDTLNPLGEIYTYSPGLDTIRYIVTSATCGSDTAFYPIVINPMPDAGVITPARDTVCQSSYVVLNETVTGGVWSSSSTANATVNSIGQVFGVSAGNVIITYSVTNACGTNYAFANIRVNNLPYAGIISGASTLCVGTPLSYTDTASSGTWGLTNTTVAVISATGTVTGISGLTGPVVDTVLYTVTNSCGTDVAMKVITINPVPYGGHILCARNPAWVCVGDSIMVSNPTGVHPATWISSDGTYASVRDAGGDSAFVLGLAAGSVKIIYHNFNFCGDAYDTLNVDVRPLGNCWPLEVGTVKASNDEITLYPNPAVSILHIESAQKINVTVLSADGKMVYKQDRVSDIDVNDFANGVYMVMIYDQDGALLKAAKFIKAN